MVAGGIEVAGNRGCEIQAVTLRGAFACAAITAHLLELELKSATYPVGLPCGESKWPASTPSVGWLEGPKGAGLRLVHTAPERCLLLDGNRLEGSCTVTASRLASRLVWRGHDQVRHGQGTGRSPIPKP